MKRRLIIASLFKQGIGCRGIAKQLGITHQAVSSSLIRMGFSPRETWSEKHRNNRAEKTQIKAINRENARKQKLTRFKDVEGLDSRTAADKLGLTILGLYKARYVAKKRGVPLSKLAPKPSPSASERKKPDPVKIKARRILNTEVRAGRVKRIPCAICGRTDSQGHHDDYLKPLDVKWFCPKHHAENHKSLPPSSLAVKP